MLKKRLVSCILALSMIACSVPTFAKQEGQNDISSANVQPLTSLTTARIPTSSDEVENIEISEDLKSIDSKQVVEQPERPADPEPLENYALGLKRPKIVGSSEDEVALGRTLESAVDGDLTTKWMSNHTIDPAKPETAEWLALDLGSVKEFNNIVLHLEMAAKSYKVEISANQGDIALEAIDDWTSIVEGGSNNKVEQILLNTPVNARYLKITSLESGDTGWPAFAIFELQVYNFTDKYRVDSGVAEIGKFLLPRYPKENFTVPLTTQNGASVKWTSNNSAISIDNTTGKATVTVPNAGSPVEGKIIAELSYGELTGEVEFNTTIYPEDNQLVDYKIYPNPQKLTRSGEKAQITKNINIVADSSIAENTKTRVKEVLDEKEYTYTFSESVSATASNLILKTYVAGDEDTYKIPVDALSKDEGGKMGEWNVFDAHVLKLSKNTTTGNSDILIDGKHNNAVYYGLATLEQILEQKDSSNNFSMVTIEDFSNSKYRGIIEGFYGFAYSKENIESLLEFGKRYKMNTFLYGPKADPYHLGFWKDPYPTELTEEQRKNGMLTQDDIKDIIQKSNENNIDFVWSVHPMMQGGVDITNEAGVEQGVKDVLNKYDLMRDLGVRHFAMFVDDISESLAVENSENQAKLVGDVVAGYKAKYPEDFKPIFYVPTLYATGAGGSEENKVRNHGAVADLENFDDIIFTFTGTGVWSHIENAEMVTMAKYLKNKQKPTFWWNSPVNDNLDPYIFVGPTDMRFNMENDVKDTMSILTNPMSQAEASKIHLFGVLDYSWNVSDYDAMQNWEDSFDELFVNDKEMAKQFKIFANHAAPDSQHDTIFKPVENYSGVDEIIADIQKTGGDTPENLNALRANMQELKDACAYLKENLSSSSNPKYVQLYKDIEQWSNKLYAMADIYTGSIDLKLSSNPKVEDYYKLANTNYRLTMTKDFYVTSLEGSGTETFEAPNFISVGGLSLNKFMPTVLGWAKNSVSDKLPQVSTAFTNKVISNTNTTGMSVSDETENGFTIVGSAGKALNTGEYIGIAMDKIVHLQDGKVLNASLEDGLVLQYSTNGKTWYDYADGDENINHMTAFRILNMSSSSITFASDVVISAHNIVAKALKAETSMTPIYDTTPNINTIRDGKWNTSFRSKSSPKQGDYVKVDYEPFTLKSLELVFNQDFLQPSIVEISIDNGVNWEKIATLNGTGLKGNTITANGAFNRVFTISNIAVRENVTNIRVTVEEKQGNAMFRCYEIVPNGGYSDGTVSTPLVATATNSWATNAIDNNPSTMFIPTEGVADELVYTLIYPEKVNTINVYMKANTTPKASVKVNGKWQDANIVKAASVDYLYTIDLSALSNISDIKLNWDENNVPETIFDIYYYGQEDSTIWSNKEDLVRTYIFAKAANKADYDNTAWETLQNAITEALDIINSQSTQEEDANMNTKLSNAIVKKDLVLGDVDEVPGIDSNDAAIILQHVLNPKEMVFNEHQKAASKVVDGKSITANDAAYVLTKVLNPEFKFPVEKAAA